MKSNDNHPNNIQSVAFIFAMKGEAMPFVTRLGLSQMERAEGAELGLKTFFGAVGSLKIYVCLNGIDPKHGVDNIGTEISAINTYCTLKEFKPDLLISAGTAGGFALQGGAIGDIYFSEGRAVRHDHRLPLPGFEEYGVGSFAVHPLKHLPETLGAKRGVVTTGNSFDMSPEDAAMIAASGAQVKEMEAAAIARIAELKNVPFIAIKAITDLADSPNNHDDFLANYSVACDALATILAKLVIYLSAGRTLEEL